jgi:hypothetical protein
MSQAGQNVDASGLSRWDGQPLTAKASQTCFHRGIRCIEGCADQGNAGGDIHHHGISAGPQSGERRAGQQDWREQVDDHHLLDMGSSQKTENKAR